MDVTLRVLEVHYNIVGFIKLRFSLIYYQVLNSWDIIVLIKTLPNFLAIYKLQM